ncbi:MAG: hypothetical protein ACR2F8_13760 [Caulobacteraceae bacterium]
MFEIELPVGPEIQVNDQAGGVNVLTHQGGGLFRATEPFWIIEGVTEDGSAAAEAWPLQFHLKEIGPPPARPSHRRIVVGWLTRRGGSTVRAVLISSINSGLCRYSVRPRFGATWFSP